MRCSCSFSLDLRVLASRQITVCFPALLPTIRAQAALAAQERAVALGRPKSVALPARLPPLAAPARSPAARDCPCPGSALLRRKSAPALRPDSSADPY